MLRAPIMPITLQNRLLASHPLAELTQMRSVLRSPFLLLLTDTVGCEPL